MKAGLLEPPVAKAQVIQLSFGRGTGLRQTGALSGNQNESSSMNTKRLNAEPKSTQEAFETLIRQQI